MKSTPVPADPRLEFIYQEALRGLLQQQSALESIRFRAATLIFATSFASSLLGSQALRDGTGALEWTALLILLGIGACAVMLLWPYYGLSFRFDAQDLLDRYVDTDKKVSMDDMHRSLALRIKKDWQGNGKIIKRMRIIFQLALVLLLLQMLVWMTAIAA